MADLVITATQVLPNGCGFNRGLLAAVAITQGQSVYLDTTVSPNVWRLAQAVAGAVTTANGIVGIAMSTSQAGQPVDVATGGSPIVGAGAAPSNNTLYCISPNAGGIAPLADLIIAGVGTPITVLGFGNSTSKAIVMPPTSPWPTGQLTT